MTVPPLSTAGKTTPRIRLLDVVRGFGLFGIFVVNLPFMANTIYDELQPGPPGSADHLASVLIAALFQLKFYLLFSFVFGYSFGVQFAEEPAGSSKNGAYLRRLVGLFVFGLVDGMFLFVGDILTSYALLGALLFRFRDWPTRRLWRAGFVALGSAMVVYTLALWNIGPNELASSVIVRETARSAYLGSIRQATAQRLHDLPIVLGFLAVTNWLPILGMFSWGLAAARRGTFNDLALFLDRHRRHALAAFALGLPANILFAAAANPAAEGPVNFVALAVSPLSAVSLSFSYLYALAWILHRWPVALAPLEKAGRLSLSHYLGQALFGACLFNGWGLGQLGKWGPADLLLLATAFFAVQLTISHYYSRWFLLGPDEWLLRSFSKLQWQPFRRPRTDIRSSTT